MGGLCALRTLGALRGGGRVRRPWVCTVQLESGSRGSTLWELTCHAPVKFERRQRRLDHSALTLTAKYGVQLDYIEHNVLFFRVIVEYYPRRVHRRRSRYRVYSLLQLQTRLTGEPTDMQARKEKFMAQIRNELALNGAQELVNVCFLLFITLLS